MSLARPYSTTSQRHLTVTVIRSRMGWAGPNCRGFWQDLRDSAQEFRIQHFSDVKWSDLTDESKRAYCAMFVRSSRHRALIEREESIENFPYISWWLLANTRCVTPQPPPQQQPPQQQQQPVTVTTRAYYDPVRG